MNTVETCLPASGSASTADQDTSGAATVVEDAKSVQTKQAAIWARVSGKSQAEASLPSQVSRCRDKAEEAGYAITHTFQVDWSSLDLFSCPEFQRLCSLIRNREIQALVAFDRDRLEARGLQRLVFLSELDEAGVELLVCQGPPFVEGPEGMIVELALAIGKERQVLRAKQGSKDGLHDRATKRRLPVTYHKLYGYRWDKSSNSLAPDDNWPNLKVIFDMLRSGLSYTPIIRELKRRAILSPSGMLEWNKTTLSSIVHNPAYAGRYFALKKMAVEPRKRRSKSYGLSSVKRLPLDESVYMPNIEVVKPPITWEERESILRQLADHQRLSRRNAKRDYLLQGMVSCETHKGQNGKPRTYHGRPHHGGWCYVCPVGGCRMPHLPGAEIENMVMVAIGTILHLQPDELYKHLQAQNQEKSRVEIDAELQRIGRQYNQNVNREVRLEEKSLAGEVLPEAYDRLKQKLANERRWIQEEKARMFEMLAQLGREEAAVKTLEQLRERYGLFDNSLTFVQCREILERLNVKVLVYSEEHRAEIISKTAEELETSGIDATRYFDQAMQPYRKRRRIDIDDVLIEIGIAIDPRVLKDVRGIASGYPVRGSP